MAKKCNYEGCKFNQFGGGYCKGHQWVRTDVVKYVNPVSEKRAAQLEEFYILQEEYLLEHPECEIKAEGCTFFSVEVHHTEGKENEQLLKVGSFLASCRNCNGIVEIKDAWARQRNFKKYRNSS